MPNFKQISLLDEARAVAASHHKGLLRQALEIMTMKKRNPGLGASDYFAFRLYDPEYIGGSRPEDFVGWREEGDVPLILNARSGVAPAWDKLTFAIFAQAYGLAGPEVEGALPAGRRTVDAPSPRSPSTPRQSLAAWLRTQTEWPLFAKPSFSEQGYGCFRFTGYERDDDALTTKRGESIPVEKFIRDIVGSVARRRELRSYKRELGYLFQEVLRPHERIVELLGTDTISGVRVILVQDETGLEFVSAEWKMAVGDSDTDNIRDYSRGNISGEVDLATGRLKRVVNGEWPNASLVTPHSHDAAKRRGFRPAGLGGNARAVPARGADASTDADSALGCRAHRPRTVPPRGQRHGLARRPGLRQGRAHAPRTRLCCNGMAIPPNTGSRNGLRRGAGRETQAGVALD